MAAQAERATVTWSTPECPFSIECSTRVLDDIRLSATDAFFSLPRGGAEIGGILLGAWQEGRLAISDYAALDCEHALGPSFTLSVSDENKLQELIRAAAGSGFGRPVGWFHSHTRSGVLLSDSDLTIHNRYFPEPWQVALVVKPHTFEPMRAGFFFRGPGGIIHSSASYHEFLIEPQPLQQVPRAAPMAQAAPPLQPPGSAGTIVDIRAEPETPRPPATPMVEVRAERAASPAPAAPIVDLRAGSETPVAPSPPDIGRPAAEPAAAPIISAVAAAPRPPSKPATEAERATPAQLPLPRAFESSPEPSRTRFKVPLAAALALAAGIALYAGRGVWYPAAAALVRPAPSQVAASSIGLNTVETAGQLQIHWNADSAPVRRATAASLEIADGDLPHQSIALDAAHLVSGAFTYAGRSARVDVTLALDQPDGSRQRQVTTFLSKEPPSPISSAYPVPPDPEHGKLVRLVDTLRTQLADERERSRKLEKELANTRAQLLQQQRRRLGNQAR